MANIELVSGWYYKNNLKEFYKIVEEGDLLEFDRGLYNHWAICVKVDGKDTLVIHRTASSTTSDFLIRSHSLNKRIYGVGTVAEELFIAVFGNDDDHCVRINNLRDGKCSLNGLPTEIVNLAYYYLKNEDELGEYSVGSNNCEHFVNLCRYGQKRSGQVDTAITAVAGTAIAIGAAVAIWSLFSDKQKKKETNKKYLAEQ